MRRLLILVILSLLLLPVGSGYAARTFDGTDDSLQTASTLTLGSATKLAVSFWLWWDGFANDFDMALETGASWNEDGGGWVVSPNYSDAASPFMFGAGNDLAYITRPSTGAWHHYVVNFDVGITTNHVVSAYLDGSSATLTNYTTSAATQTFGNKTLNFMSRANSSLFGAGRMADVAIWTGIALSGTDVTDLNNGTLPTSVQSGSLVYYWKICGNDSPETATTGGLNATVNGTTQSSHPSAVSSSCGGASAAPRGLLLGVYP